MLVLLKKPPLAGRLEKPCLLLSGSLSRGLSGQQGRSSQGYGIIQGQSPSGHHLKDLESKWVSKLIRERSEPICKHNIVKHHELINLL